MSLIYIESQQAGTPTPDRAGVSRDELRQQIRQTIQDAVQSARDAAQEARDANRRVRDARLQVRDAEQRLRNARTPDQRAAATQAVADAKARLADAEAALRTTHPIVRVDGAPVIAPGIPGTPTQVYVGGGSDNVIPPQAVDMALAFFIMCAVIIIGWPIARAFGRRIERRGEVATMDPVVASQLQRIEQAVEAMSIEVERISESQRFMAKLQSGGESSGVPVERR